MPEDLRIIAVFLFITNARLVRPSRLSSLKIPEGLRIIVVFLFIILLISMFREFFRSFYQGEERTELLLQETPFM